MATKANLIIDQGATYSTTIDIADEYGVAINLTNYTGAAQMRKHYTSSNAASFTVSLGGADGTLTLSMSANATANIVAGRYVYDVELTSNTGVISRVLEGIVTVTPNVTR
jgi:hypothetical protein